MGKKITYLVWVQKPHNSCVGLQCYNLCSYTPYPRRHVDTVCPLDDLHCAEELDHNTPKVASAKQESTASSWQFKSMNIASWNQSGTLKSTCGIVLWPQMKSFWPSRESLRSRREDNENTTAFEMERKTCKWHCNIQRGSGNRQKAIPKNLRWAHITTLLDNMIHIVTHKHTLITTQRNQSTFEKKKHIQQTNLFLKWIQTHFISETNVKIKTKKMKKSQIIITLLATLTLFKERILDTTEHVYTFQVAFKAP